MTIKVKDLRHTAEPLLVDDGVRLELAEFYERAIRERGYPEARAKALTDAFEVGLARDGRWAPIVLKDLGLEEVRAYRRVAPPKDQRDEFDAALLKATQ